MKVDLRVRSKFLKIDLKDRKILELLQHDARESRTVIAKKTGLSKDMVNYRIHNYETKGLIQGYRTLVDVEKLGYWVCHLFLQLKTPDVAAEKEIVAKLRANPYTRAVIKFSGKYDLEVALIARGVRELDGVVSNILAECNPHIQSYDVEILSETYVAKSFPSSFMSHGKETYKNSEIPIKTLDNTDRKILSLLSDDAKADFFKLSQKLQMSYDTIRYRIAKMRESGIILKFVPAINYNAIGYTFYCLMMNIGNIDAKLKELVFQDDNIIWAVKAIGKYNLIAYVCVKESSSLHETINKIRSHYPGQITEYEIMIAFEEYKYTYYPEILYVEENEKQ